mmetsp:Transcript_17946/g.54094  ORF Transcript_17946/g.54094 Transcript_17946/m.54094 type:complete len:273 (+) Transcript_17946:56-874(+)
MAGGPAMAVRRAPSRRQRGATAVLALCAVLACLQGSLCSGPGGSAFTHLQPGGRLAAPILVAPHPHGLPAVAAEVSADVVGSSPAAASQVDRVGIAAAAAFLWAAGLAATKAKAAGNAKEGTLAGAACDALALTDVLSASTGLTDSQPRIVMNGVKHRPHVRIAKRTYKDWLRGRRRNSAAKKRFLVKADGTIWRRQPGLRHLKSKKSPAKLKRLRKLVRITRDEYKRVQILTGKRPPVPKAADFIMRKFNEAREKKHLGLSDRGIGTALFA